tara:strand:- start:46 stop:456 length:411 start_codon:yes stop_codon:yes gene_type:complete
MKVDQLILWLSKCKIEKRMHLDSTDFPVDKSFYYTGKSLDLALGEITFIDVVLFPLLDLDPSNCCEVHFAVHDELVIAASWWTAHEEVPYHRDFTKFGSINSADDLFNYLKEAVKSYQLREEELEEMFAEEMLSND